MSDVDLQLYEEVLGATSRLQICHQRYHEEPNLQCVKCKAHSHANNGLRELFKDLLECTVELLYGLDGEAK